MYNFLKDFAAPLATVVVGLVALWITYTFSRIQADIAASQRDIALDKLKVDLFRNRYEIYEAAKSLLEHIPFVTELQKSDATKIRTLYVKIDEGRFYYPPDICAVLTSIHDHCEAFLVLLGNREQSNLDDHAEWSRIADAMAEQQRVLRSIYATLPKTFEPALAFRQLTRP